MLQLSLEQLSYNALRAVYRYLRQVVGISLRSLVARPGEVAMTRTHLDYIFDGSNVDMRVRSNGLDVNPGWIAWLARVVSFQYRFHEGSYDVR